MKLASDPDSVRSRVVRSLKEKNMGTNGREFYYSPSLRPFPRAWERMGTDGNGRELHPKNGAIEMTATDFPGIRADPLTERELYALPSLLKFYPRPLPFHGAVTAPGCGLGGERMPTPLVRYSRVPGDAGNSHHVVSLVSGEADWLNVKGAVKS